MPLRGKTTTSIFLHCSHSLISSMWVVGWLAGWMGGMALKAASCNDDDDGDDDDAFTVVGQLSSSIVHQGHTRTHIRTLSKAERHKNPFKRTETCGITCVGLWPIVVRKLFLTEVQENL